MPAAGTEAFKALDAEGVKAYLAARPALAALLGPAADSASWQVGISAPLAARLHCQHGCLVTSLAAGTEAFKALDAERVKAYLAAPSARCPVGACCRLCVLAGQSPDAQATKLNCSQGCCKSQQKQEGHSIIACRRREGIRAYLAARLALAALLGPATDSGRLHTV